jgi:hypothetical protein
VTPNPEASVTIYALSTLISHDLMPIDPHSEFAPGFACIYVFYEFHSMDGGLPWTRTLYRDGLLLEAEHARWGPYRDGERFYYFCRPEDGFIAGDYELQFFVGDELATSAAFTVREP